MSRVNAAPNSQPALVTKSLPKILIVDDEPMIRELVQQILAKEFEVITAENGSDAIRVATENSPDVIVMDILMPRMNGLAACRSLRSDSRTRNAQIIMLTAINDSKNRIDAFEAGADDFLPKPFLPEELRSRIRSKVRRATELREPVVAEPAAEVLSCGNIRLDLSRMELAVGDRVCTLGVVQLRILKYFMENPDRVISRQEIAAAVWDDSNTSDRLLDPHINSLRKKLERADNSISTVYGIGYRLKPVSRNERQDADPVESTSGGAQ